jgi:hypothetical protein
LPKPSNFFPGIMSLYHWYLAPVLPVNSRS